MNNFLRYSLKIIYLLVISTFSILGIKAQTLHFITQSELDVYPNNLQVVDTLIIGNFSIPNTSIVDLSSLSALDTVGFLFIYQNDALVSLNGLNHLEEVLSKTIINGNDVLEDISALSNLLCGGEFSIINSPALTSLNGIHNIQTFGTTFQINNCDALVSLDGFNATYMGGYLVIKDNENLVHIDALSSIINGGPTLLLNVENNPNLSACSILCDLYDNPNNTIIEDNLSPCNLNIGTPPNSEFEEACVNMSFPNSNSSGSTCDCPSVIIFSSQEEINNYCFNCTESDDISIEINDASDALNDIIDLSPIGVVPRLIELKIDNTPNLLNVNGLENIHTINTLYINNCDGLVHLNGLSDTLTISKEIYVARSANIETTPEIYNSENSIQFITFLENPKLVDISIIRNIRASNILQIHDNPLLSDCSPACFALANPGTNGNDISLNDTNCETETVLMNNCIESECSDNDNFIDCTQDNLFLNNIDAVSDTFHAINTLISNTVLDENTNIGLKASECIELKSGFESTENNNVDIIIEDCIETADVLKDFGSMSIFGSDSVLQNIVYPITEIYTFLDRDQYYQSDISAMGVAMMQYGYFESCRSMTVKIFSKDYTTNEFHQSPIDENYYQIDWDKNLHYTIDLEKLLDIDDSGESEIEFKIEVSKLNGSTSSTILSLKKLDAPDFNPPASNIIPLNILKSDNSSTAFVSSITGAVPMPNGFIRDSTLHKLRLKNLTTGNYISNLLIQPVSHWSKHSQDINAYVKWMKVSFVGNVYDQFQLELSTNNQSNTIISSKLLCSEFYPFSTDYFDISIQSDTLSILKKGSQANQINLLPKLNQGNLDYRTNINTIQFLENNNIRKVIRIEGSYHRMPVDTAIMNYVTIVKVYQNEPAIHVKHQDIFTSVYYDDEFIEQIGYCIQSDQFNSSPVGFNYSNLNNTSTSTLNDGEYLLHHRKNSFVKESIGTNSTINIEGQLDGVFDLPNDWVLGVANFKHKFPNEFENKTGEGKVWINSWPTHWVENAFSTEEKLDYDGIYKLFPMHMGDTLSLKNEDIITDVLEQDYLFNGDPIDFSLGGTLPDYLLYKQGFSKPYNIDHIPANGMAMGVDFSIYLNENDLSLDQHNKNVNNRPRLFTNGSWFSRSEVEPGIFDPDLEISPLLQNTIRHAYPGYKKHIFDNPNQNYGMFTYGCMHDKANFYPDGNELKLCTCNEISGSGGCHNIKRTWSFAHYRNIWASWLFALINADVDNLSSARVLSDNFINIGTKNSLGPNNNLKGSMAHAYAGEGKSPYTRSEYFPWGNSSTLSGHWVNPTGFLYAYLLDDNFIAKDLYDSWFVNYYNNFASFGGNRNGAQMKGELLYHHHFYNDPRSLSIFCSFKDIDVYRNSGTFYNNQDDYYKGYNNFIYWHDNWIKLFEKQFRSTTIPELAISYYSVGGDSATYNFPTNIKSKKEALDLGVWEEEDFKRTIIPFLSSAYSMVNHDPNSELEKFGNLAVYSKSHVILHKIPYVLKYMENYDFEDLTKDFKKAHYLDKESNRNNEPFMLNLLIKNDTIQDETVLELEKSIDYFTNADMLQYREGNQFLDNEELINNLLVNDANYGVNIELSTTEQVIDFIEPVELISQTFSNKKWTYHSFENDSKQLLSLYAPFQSDSLEVQRLRETSPCDGGEGVNFQNFFDQPELCVYQTGGYNQYFLGTIDDVEFDMMIDRFWDPESPRAKISTPVYYKFGFVKPNINDENFPQTSYESFIDQFFSIETAGKDLNIDFGDDFIIQEGYVMGSDSSYVIFEDIEIGHYPALLFCSSMELSFDIRLLLEDLDESNDIYAEDIYLSTNWENIVKFREDINN